MLTPNRMVLLVLLFAAGLVPAVAEPPGLARLPRLTLGDAPRLGEPTARIAVVEFSDYQCPFCARLDHEMLPTLVRDYVTSGVVLYVHKDFPLRSNPQAVPAALSARCAGAQGKFWEMHRKLYLHQRKLSDKAYPELAKELGLDVSKFNDCRNAKTTRADLLRDIRQGQALGVRETPTLMIGRIGGDRMIVERIAIGNPGYQKLVEEIERLRTELTGGLPSAPK
jgi:protein-disulfide isomerase